MIAKCIFIIMKQIVSGNEKVIAVIFLFLLGMIDANAQTKHPILDKLNLFEVNGAVHIDCTITAGYTCNGISYYRSDGGEEFKKIGEVSGICGSPDFAVRYQFIDEDPPKNQPLRYMVDFGGYGNTEELSIEVVDTDLLGYQVRPNPTAGQSLIFFRNTSNSEHYMRVYDLSGRQVYSGQTIEKFFEIDLTGNAPGLYIFNILEDKSGSRLHGKIVLQ